MKREELTELHYITPLANLTSILKYGIQSHRRVNNAIRKGAILSSSVAMPEVQEKRATKRVPGGGSLHDYVNLYFSARNPMLYKRKDLHADLCILRIDTDVLNTDGAVVTDRNAAASIARFFTVDEGLARLDRDLVFADDWRHDGDGIALRNHRAVKCAEALIPDRIIPLYITGAYVSCKRSREVVTRIVPDLEVVIDPYLFFVDTQEQQ